MCGEEAPQKMKNPKELAQQLYEQLNEVSKLRIIAGDELRIEILEDDEGELTEECCAAILEELRATVFEKEAPPAYIRLDGGILRDTYCVFGNLDDNEALYDNLDAFDVNLLFCKFRNKFFVMEDSPFGEQPQVGFFFLALPKWQREAVQQALANYANRIDWQTPGIKRLGQEAVAQMELAHRGIK